MYCYCDNFYKVELKKFIEDPEYKILQKEEMERVEKRKAWVRNYMKEYRVKMTPEEKKRTS